MNKKTIKLLSLLSIGTIIAIGCADRRKAASVYLRTTVPAEAKVLTCVADESRFWCVLQLTPEQSVTFTETVKKSASWHPMPLTQELMDAADYLQPHEREFRGQIPIANTNGYYTLLDLEAEYAAKHPDPASLSRMKEPFQKRGGLNYVFGYFDDIAGKVYVWWCHT